MSTAALTLRIGSGRGPHEARRFVGMLAEALRGRLADQGLAVHDVEHHGDAAAPGRVLLRVDPRAETCVAPLVGTHRLTAQLRGRGQRRRWFVHVELDTCAPAGPPRLPRRELEIRFVRAGGPGGQHVNKRSTAVRITHRPTGLVTRCDTHRSQARNRDHALQALTAAVAQHTHQHHADRQRARAWRGRRDITTHHPVMCWQLHPHEPGAIVPAPE